MPRWLPSPSRLSRSSDLLDPRGGPALSTPSAGPRTPKENHVTEHQTTDWHLASAEDLAGLTNRDGTVSVRTLRGVRALVHAAIAVARDLHTIAAALAPRVVVGADLSDPDATPTLAAQIGGQLFLLPETAEDRTAAALERIADALDARATMPEVVAS